MSYTYDLSSPVGLVRLYTGDTNDAGFVFSDAEMRDFLTRAGGSPHRAAALALTAIAASNRLMAMFVTNGNPNYVTPIRTHLEDQVRLYRFLASRREGPRTSTKTGDET